MVRGFDHTQPLDLMRRSRLLKMEDDGELSKTLVKLRRTPSDTPRPASTPPVIAASAIQDEDEEEKIMAELEVRFSTTARRFIPSRVRKPLCPLFPNTEAISEVACKRS